MDIQLDTSKLNISVATTRGVFQPPRYSKIRMESETPRPGPLALKN
ncbi:hypothetical protein PDE_07031 [Penicillium oxalicum 114-2]|uniref:Uncharacterized protein n=1 Tax=Penicillium oxalicum (strain 114-2 / CGMCC 5302) TaxID=933388 RepID=S8BB34_PENO1|nr:hypothetical protein PDE_07031 [Penicillium oxalicum 114-2]